MAITLRGAKGAPLTIGELDANFQELANNRSADTIIDGTNNKVLTAAEKSKLADIAAGATVNRADSATDALIGAKLDSAALSAVGSSLVGAASQAAGRAALGLGSASTQATGAFAAAADITGLQAALATKAAAVVAGSGSTLYLDSVAGDDSAAGTAQVAPFQTLTRAMTALAPGGTLNLKRGSVFRETLTIDKQAVTVAAYGTGNAPRISGGSVVDDHVDLWTQEVTTPVAVDVNTFEGSTLSASWTTQAGAVDTTRAKNGTKSWRIEPTSGDMVARRFLISSYVEMTGFLYIDGSKVGTSGQQARVMGIEGGSWNAANGVNVMLSNLSGTLRLGLARGAAPVSNSNVTTNTFIQYRFVVSANNGAGADFARLYLNGSASPAAEITGMTLASESSQLNFGLFAFNPTAFAVNFDDLAVWSSSSVPLTTNNWYTPGITVEPLVVTADGAVLQRRLVKTKLATTGDWWWDAVNKRLYIYRTTNPASGYDVIEYSQRLHPMRVRAAAAVISDLVISHHNLDDGTIGLEDLTAAASLTNVTGQTNGKDVVDYTYQPGRSDSIWRKRLDGTKTYTAAPAGFNALGTGLAGWGLPDPSSIGVYVATASDPLVNVLFVSNAWVQMFNGVWQHRDNTAEAETAIRAAAAPVFPSTPYGSRSRYNYQTISDTGSKWALPTWPIIQPTPDLTTGAARQVRRPANAYPSGDFDSHLAIHQPDGTVIETYATMILADGTICCSNYNLTRAGSTLTGQEAGVSAALVPNFAGVITDAEVSAGEIPHAISIVIPPTHLNRSVVPPATTYDRTPGYTGTLPMGTRLAIPFSVNLAAHVFESPLGRMMAQAAQDYGVIIMDRGGAGLTFRNQFPTPANPVMHLYSGGAGNDITWIVSQLQVVAP